MLAMAKGKFALKEHRYSKDTLRFVSIDASSNGGIISQGY